MLTKEIPRVLDLGEVNTFVLAASTTIFRGAAVGDNGLGFARPLIAGDTFLGFCESTATNLPSSPGVPAAQGGNGKVKVLCSGRMQLMVAGLKSARVQAPVYAVDDNNFTLTAGVNSFLGAVHRVVDDTTAIVAFGHLASASQALHKVLLAGSYKTVGGGVMEKIPLPGLLTTDFVQVTPVSLGKNPCKLLYATPVLGSLHLSFDADPGTDHVLHYVIYRAVA
jgi:hypothetical protein